LSKSGQNILKQAARKDFELYTWHHNYIIKEYMLLKLLWVRALVWKVLSRSLNHVKKIVNEYLLKLKKLFLIIKYLKNKFDQDSNCLSINLIRLWFSLIWFIFFPIQILSHLLCLRNIESLVFCLNHSTTSTENFVRVVSNCTIDKPWHRSNHSTMDIIHIYKNDYELLKMKV
jgi:hypothetical protein